MVQVGPADAHDGTNWARLMLMMLASWGQVVQIGPADAHDAGF